MLRLLVVEPAFALQVLEQVGRVLSCLRLVDAEHAPVFVDDLPSDVEKIGLLLDCFVCLERAQILLTLGPDEGRRRMVAMLGDAVAHAAGYDSSCRTEASAGSGILVLTGNAAKIHTALSHVPITDLIVDLGLVLHFLAVPDNDDRVPLVPGRSLLLSRSVLVL